MHMLTQHYHIPRLMKACFSLSLQQCTCKHNLPFGICYFSSKCTPGDQKPTIPRFSHYFHASLYSLIARSHFLSCIKPRRAGVKVETWNVIRLCPNLQLQIVWNWFGVLALFWQSRCNWIHFLVKGDKGNAELGNWIVIAVYLFRLVAQRSRLKQCYVCLEGIEDWKTSIFGLQVHVFGTLRRMPLQLIVGSNETHASCHVYSYWPWTGRQNI